MSPPQSATSPSTCLPFAQEDYVRVLLRSLTDMGYKGAARALEQESGCTLHVPTVRALREAVVGGHWDECLTALQGVQFKGEWSRARAIFQVLQQKYIELLLAARMEEALTVLHDELSLLCEHAPEHVESGNHQTEPELEPTDSTALMNLQALAALLLCPDEWSIRAKAGWSLSSSVSDEREALVCQLMTLMDPGMHIPAGRLEELVSQALALQCSKCPYHNTTLSHLNLCEDHACSLKELPIRTSHILDGHFGREVWSLAFSHDGGCLATGSVDGAVVVWRLQGDKGVRAVHRIELRAGDVNAPVALLRWSPDDTHILAGCEQPAISCCSLGDGGVPHIARLEGHTDTVMCIEWLPDSDHFVSGSLDKTILLWTAAGQVLASWRGERVTDMTITGTHGYTEVTAVCRQGTLSRFAVYPPASPTSATNANGNANVNGNGSGNGNVNGVIEELSAVAPVLGTKPIMGIRASADGSRLLVWQDTGSGACHGGGSGRGSSSSGGGDALCCWDLSDDAEASAAAPVPLRGFCQGRYLLRAAFGGHGGSSFAAGGSIDGSVHLWRIRDGQPLLRLLGHSDTVNAVEWSPCDAHTLASASDDGTVRIWRADTDGGPEEGSENGAPVTVTL
ncbi:WD40-repeat-containing domain protein [Tribonema minus]|uniref:WD40-repeat-containing domain protein n=1 Tax=Tribonema minus TaxID=303371 RepID=A0A836C942_9STRA|nr:WD40-repeat-containing domain protein [Tribonema minus]